MLTTLSNSPFYLFYFVNAKGESYYVDQAGQVQLSGLPRPLQSSPDGWQDLSIGWDRNLSNLGLVRNFSLSLGWAGDGAQILNWLAIRKTVDEKVWLLVQIRTIEVTPYLGPLVPGTWDPIYRFYYKGELDLSSWKWKRRRPTVNIMEGGLYQALQAGQDKTQEIPLDDPSTIRVKLPGLKFRHSAVWGHPTGLQISNNDYDFFAFPSALISTEGTGTGATFLEAGLEVVANVSDYTDDSLNYPVYINQAVTNNPITLNFTGKVRYKVLTNDIAGFVRFFFRTNLGQQPPGFVSGTPHPVGSTQEININQVITLQPGEKLFFLGFIGSNVTGAVEIKIEFLENSRLECNYINSLADTFVRVWKPFDLFSWFTLGMAGKYAGTSNLLATSEICFTSGDGIRRLPGAKIKETFKNFASFWKAVKAAHVGVEGPFIRIDPWTSYLKDDLVDEVDLGEIKDLEIENAVELMGNLLKMGYPDQTYDELNGRFETNCLQERQLPIKRVVKTLEILSPIRTDIYGIETLRINLDGKTTTDSDSDNDTFAILVDLAHPQNDADGVYYDVKREFYTATAGIFDPAAAYNIEELSPLRMLEEWKTWLAGVLQGYQAEKIVFNSATKNRDQSTTSPNFGTFDEDADVLVKDLPAGKFLPKILSFTARAKVNLAAILAARPWSSFRCTYQGQLLRGYLLRGSIKNRTNQEQAFRLLSHIDNDLTPFENE